MEIQRYLNGVPISERELSQVATATPELTAAVREANKRLRQGGLSQGMSAPPLTLVTKPHE